MTQNSENCEQVIIDFDVCAFTFRQRKRAAFRNIIAAIDTTEKGRSIHSRKCCRMLSESGAGRYTGSAKQQKKQKVFTRQSDLRNSQQGQVPPAQLCPCMARQRDRLTMRLMAILTENDNLSGLLSLQDDDTRQVLRKIN